MGAYLAAVWAETEMLDGLSGVLWSSQEKSVLTLRALQCQLIQSHGLTTSLLDSSLGGSGKSEGGNVQLWDGEETVVIGDGSNDNDGLSLVLLTAVLVGGV